MQESEDSHAAGETHLAPVALAAGILSVLAFPVGIVLGPLALVLGLRAADRTPGPGRAPALWGVALGSAATVLGAAYIILYVL